MFCPECKSEYREGFKHCPSCDVELVVQLSKSVAEPRWENADLVTVFVSLNPAEAALAKSALEGSGVEVSLVDDNVSRVESGVSRSRNLCRAFGSRMVSASVPAMRCRKRIRRLV